MLLSYVSFYFANQKCEIADPFWLSLIQNVGAMKKTGRFYKDFILSIISVIISKSCTLYGDKM